MTQAFIRRIRPLVVLVWTASAVWAQTGPVRINEIAARNTATTNLDGRVTDWLELFNTSAAPVSLAGYMMSDTNYIRFTFPAGVSIAAKGFLVMSCDTNRAASSTNMPFGLDGTEGFVYLFPPGNTTTPVDVVHYGLQVEDFPIGRVPDGTGAFALCAATMRGTNAAVALGPVTALRINEWMADNGKGADWFEIHNTTNKPVALGGLRLSDANPSPTTTTIPPLSFMGEGFRRGYRKFVADNPTNGVPADHVAFTMSKASETLSLLSSNGATVLDSVSFTGQVANVSEGRFPDGSAFIRAFPTVGNVGGDTPGEPNLLVMTNLVVNELLSHTDPPLEDAVEFLNLGTNTIDISGWWISNARLDPFRARIPTGPALPPGGTRVIFEHQFNTNAASMPAGYPVSNILVSFTFNAAHGDECHLFEVATNGALTGWRCSEFFEAASNGTSFGRHDTSVPGDYKFVAQSRRSFGTNAAPATLTEFRQGTGLANAAPLVGPLVIDEILFSPLPTIWGTNTTARENPEDEFIELRNLSTQVIPLYYVDPANPSFQTNGWSLFSGVAYTFPQGASLQATSRCLLVAFDPVNNPASAARFRSYYGVPAAVPLFGPWTGRLDNAGEAIDLYRPDTPQQPPHPDAGYVPYFRIDKVNYSTNAPWPQAAAGTGLSIQRIRSSVFGNDPANWTNASPTAGRDTSADIADLDGDGMTDGWERRYGLDPASPGDRATDADQDGFANFAEFLTGTDPTNAASLFASSCSNSAAGLLLSWPSATGRTYAIEGASANLTVFTNVATGLPATPPQNTFLALPSGAVQAYRVRLTP